MIAICVYLCMYFRHGTGLQELCRTFLGIKLDKSKEISCSDWESDTLTEEQIEYAAGDAIVAIYVLKELLNGYGGSLGSGPDYYSMCSRQSLIETPYANKPQESQHTEVLYHVCACTGGGTGTCIILVCVVQVCACTMLCTSPINTTFLFYTYPRMHIIMH